MDIREMKYILEISKARNITHAAANLFISQPALHKALHKIEEEYGTPLFYREGRELFPTDAGRIIIEQAGQIVRMSEGMDQQIAAIRNLKTGKVTLGFPSVVGSIYFPEFLARFQHIYPGISLKTVEKGGATLLKMTESGEVDVAIVMRPVYSQDINEYLIIRERVVACVNKNHPWAKKEHVKISDFRDVPFVTFEEGFNLHTQIIRRLHEENIKPGFALTGADSQFLYRYAMCSGNILVLPEPMIKLACDDDSIKLIPFRPNWPWELSLIYKKNTYLSYASKALINEIQTAFST